MKTPKIIKYKNGLTLVYLRKTHQKTVYLNMIFGGGLYNEPKDKLGLSHFAEHTISLSDKNCSHEEKIEYLRKIFYRSFSTSKEKISFRSYSHKDLFEDIFKTYCQYLSTCELNEEEFENERKVIEQEILRRRVDINVKLGYMINEYIYDLPYPETRPAGTIETVNNITIEDVENFRKENFTLNNLTVVIVGNISLLKSKALIKKYVLKSFNQVAPKKYIEANDFCKKTQKPVLKVEESPDGDKSMILVSHYYDVEELGGECKGYISAFINEIMQNAARSYFRDKYGLTYSPNIGFHVLKYEHDNAKFTRCYFRLNIDCDKNNVAKVMEVLPGFYQYLEKYKFDKENFKEIKKIIERDEQMLLKIIPIDTEGDNVSFTYFDRKNFKTTAQRRKNKRACKKVTYSDVNNHIALMLSQKPFIFVITNSEDKLPEYKIICKQIQDNIKWCKSINE